MVEGSGQGDSEGLPRIRGGLQGLRGPSAS